MPSCLNVKVVIGCKHSSEDSKDECTKQMILQQPGAEFSLSSTEHHRV